EDREAQVWFVHARYYLGRLERDLEHFEVAATVFRKALDHLQQLDREGKLEGRPAFKFRHMRVLQQDLVFCTAAPRVLAELPVAGRQTPYATVNLLTLRARRLAELDRGEELAATVEALCAFDEGDWEDRYNLARALASCLPYLDDASSSVAPVGA